MVGWPLAKLAVTRKEQISDHVSIGAVNLVPVFPVEEDVQEGPVPSPVRVLSKLPGPNAGSLKQKS